MRKDIKVTCPDCQESKHYLAFVDPEGTEHDECENCRELGKNWEAHEMRKWDEMGVNNYPY